MCECIEYADGSRYRCVVCEDMARANEKLLPKLLDDLASRCSCSEEYRNRQLRDPGCDWCCYSDETKAALRHHNGESEVPW